MVTVALLYLDLSRKITLIYKKNFTNRFYLVFYACEIFFSRNMRASFDEKQGCLSRAEEEKIK